jgi:murein DD-endopeptidase MepM/ murein hydrolase activator NlpD
MLVLWRTVGLFFISHRVHRGKAGELWRMNAPVYSPVRIVCYDGSKYQRGIMSLLRISIIIGNVALLLACANPSVLSAPTPTTQISASTTPVPATPTAVATVTLEPSATITTTETPTSTATEIPTATAVTAQYVFPVQHAEVNYGKFHHDYPATDMFCDEGSEFVAVTAGVVDYISFEDIWDPVTNEPNDRGGLAVAIIGSDGVRYYGSHLQAIAPDLHVGMTVTAGQLLGLTGKSGDARSTPAHLHFGISHPTTPEDWQVRRGEISPYPYLQAWRKGEMRAPVLP